METIGQYLKLGISDYDNSKLYGSIKLGLFDLAGKRIVKSTISKDNPSIQVNISNLSKGMYFCKAEGKDFQIAKHVLICKL
jgi:hypothetical protein